jgi:hypothetical protein
VIFSARKWDANSRTKVGNRAMMQGSSFQVSSARIGFQARERLAAAPEVAKAHQAGWLVFNPAFRADENSVPRLLLQLTSCKIDL